MQAEPAATGTTSETPTIARIAQLQCFMQQWMHDGTDYGLIPGKGDKPSLFKPGAQKLMAEYNLASKIADVNEQGDSTYVKYRITVTLLNKLSGMIEGEGVGECDSRENKYSKQTVANISNTVLKMAKKRALVDAVLDATGASVIFTQDIEDMPDDAFTNRSNGYTPRTQPSTPDRAPSQSTPAPRPTPQQAIAQAEADGFLVPNCRRCGGAMYDNREGKKNPKAPDFKCKDKNCVDEKGYVSSLWMRDLQKQGGSFSEIENAQRDERADADNYAAASEAFTAAAADDDEVATQQQVDDYNACCDYFTSITGTIRQHAIIGVTARKLAAAHKALEKKITEAESSDETQAA